ncbi:MAG TPA: hypothetical protein VF041_11060 [Gemmatimonadaceae bacterium]
MSDAPPAGTARVHRDRFVSASELAEWAYCRRAWWLRVVRGATSEREGERFQAGRDAHRRHADSLRLARALAVAAALALAAALAVHWVLAR